LKTKKSAVKKKTVSKTKVIVKKTKSKTVKKKTTVGKVALKKTQGASKNKILKKTIVKTKAIKKDKKLEEKPVNLGMLKRQRKTILTKEEVRKYLIQNAGEHALVIVQNLVDPTTDEDLAKKMKVRVSEIRSTLNKLHGLRLAKYSRSKDEETGWYTYKWNVRHGNVMDMTHVIESKLSERLSIIPEMLYYCSNCSDEAWGFDEAMDMKFKCPRCGSVLNEADQEFKERLKKLYI
jgi:transcription initiation factor TFIIE subunit alpha